MCCASAGLCVREERDCSTTAAPNRLTIRKITQAEENDRCRNARFNRMCAAVIRNTASASA